MEPKFSIIVPTFNRRKHIETAIDSALNQDYPEKKFEIIIIDDGSIDGTEDLIRSRYKNELEKGRISLIVLPDNKGASWARNEGIRNAKNEWIAYLDTDNSLNKLFLKSFAESISKNPEKKSFYAQIKHTSSGKIVGEDFDFFRLTFANFIDLGAFVHSKKLFSELGGFDTKLTRLIDWDLVIRYTNKFPPKFIKKVLVNYYDGNSIPRISNSESQEENYKIISLKYLDTLSPRKFLLRRKEEYERVLEKEKVIEKKSKEIERLNARLQSKEQQLISIVSTLRWKVPNYIYKVIRKILG